MPRFHQLVEELEKIYPEDWWIKSMREPTLPLNEFPQAAVYEQALRGLDEHSWAILSEKALKVFSVPISDRGKDNFFNLLNEALAYEYLVSEGFNNIQIVQSNPKRKSPDISYEIDLGIRYCEVKTIGMSKDELDRAKSGDVLSNSIYSSLNHNFFAKLCSTICSAVKQIETVSGTGSVYLIVHFDDFTLNNFETYKKQISEFLASAFPKQDVIVRIGIAHARYIWHGDSNRA